MKPLWGCLAFVAAAALLIVIFLGGYLRLATTVIGDFVSPDGMHDAVLMVRNGGAAAGYSTDVSLVRAHDPLARQIALFKSGALFVIDDNDGAVRWGDRGQLDVKIKWVSNTRLIIQYPARARVFKQKTSCQSTTVRYEPLERPK
jgi:hypothetical protein